VDPEAVESEALLPAGDEPVVEIPPLVAVVVTHDPGPWFTETLQSLADQTYPDLAVLVIDTASEQDPGDLVHSILPAAHVHYLDHDPGFAGAANLVRELVEGATFYAFCHDDIALDPDALRTLVEEAFRSNAGVIGPKLVSWGQDRRPGPGHRAGRARSRAAGRRPRRFRDPRCLHRGARRSVRGARRVRCRHRSAG
jgi:GT2 family glycosyltransferase